MNKKFELLREAVKTYKVNHCDGDKNEKELLEFIDELEQLTTPVVVGRSEQLICGKNITTCVFYKDGGKCSNLEYCKDQTT